MTLWTVATLMTGLLAAGPGDMATVVQAPDSPVRLDKATILRVPDAPAVLLYSATNTTEQTLDQFTVMVFVFDAQGRLKARHVAPGRRTLEPRESKYSAMVLDGAPVFGGLRATDAKCGERPGGCATPILWTRCPLGRDWPCSEFCFPWSLCFRFLSSDCARDSSGTSR